MKTLIIADTHFHSSRVGGTTKKSRKSLEDWQLQQFRETLLIPHDRLIIAGDLTDKRNIPEHLMKQLIDTLQDENCIILLGNHDLAGVDDHTMSSTEFIALMSGSTLIGNPETSGNLYLLPHMFSQEGFDRAIQDAPDKCTVICHANIDNFFAVGDHSLNLSLQQLVELEKRGISVISGHEHAQREYHNVTVIGCQTPTSIADCLSGDKRCLVLEDGKLTAVKTWSAKENYYEGSEIPEEHYDFINITGQCELAEYAGIVKQVAALRSTASAFIVKNGFKVKEFESAEHAEEITKFNVIEMLLEEVHPDYREEVKECL